MRRPRSSRARAAPKAALRERLRQAQETLRAIQHDEVDALVVKSRQGTRVAVLEGSGHPYAALIEHINEGAITLSGDGNILYCNGFLARFLRVPGHQVVGSQFRRIVAPDSHAAFDSLLARGIEGNSHSELTLISEDGIRRQVELSLFPLAPMVEGGKAPPRGRIGLIGILTNLDALKASEQRLETRVRQQVAIAGLGDRALAGVSVDAILNDATRVVAAALGASRCSIAELLPGGERLRIRASTGAPADHVDGVGSALSMVIPGEDAPFGVLEVSPGPRSFSGDDRHFLQAVANILAAAIIRKRSEDLRRTLLEELTRSRDGERRRLSRELHDETGQALWALIVGLDALESAAGPTEARAVVHRLHAIAARTLDDVGRLARGLHPGALDDHGLVAAASQYLREFTSSYGIPVEQEIEDLGGERLPPQLEITLYRALQEALTNVARHARARSVRVTLRREAATVELAVADDGVGFVLEPARSPAKPRGLGLHGMRERAMMLGGEVTVASRPGAGTTVRARIPLHAAEDQ